MKVICLTMTLLVQHHRLTNQRENSQLHRLNHDYLLVAARIDGIGEHNHVGNRICQEECVIQIFIPPYAATLSSKKLHGHDCRACQVEKLLTADLQMNRMQTDNDTPTVDALLKSPLTHFIKLAVNEDCG